MYEAAWKSAFVFGTAVWAAVVLSSEPHAASVVQSPSDETELLQATLDRYCLTCHSERLQTADLSLEGLDLSRTGEHAEVWEKVVRKLRTRSMPPVGRQRPEDATYDRIAGWLETELDRFSAARANPGRTEAFHRLNRAEYANAVRDLLALDVDVAALLPADDIDEHGFDNMADVLTVSPALMERYLSAARKIARLAVGETPLGPATETYKIPILLIQDDRMGEDVPFGSRGGTGFRHHFPVDGEYDVTISLHRNYVNYVRGMGSSHELEVRLDGRLVETFVFGGGGAGRHPGPGQLRRQPVRRSRVGRVHAVCGRRHAGPVAGPGGPPRRQHHLRPEVHRAGRGAPAATERICRRGQRHARWQRRGRARGGERSLYERGPRRHAEPGCHLHVPSGPVHRACARRGGVRARHPRVAGSSRLSSPAGDGRPRHPD